jgi:copper chaperone CopZ
MHRRTALLVIAGGAAGLAARRAQPAQVAGDASIAIQVADMHGAACARKIARKLYTVAGVVGVTTDYAADMAWVTPEARRLPSPRALWEAVEGAGFAPLVIEGPFGTFTAKPQR